MALHLKLVIPMVIGELLFLFGLLAWIYGVIIQLVHPEFLSTTLSHLIPWIRVDTFTIISFFLSAIGFVLWRLIKEIFNLSKKD